MNHRIRLTSGRHPYGRLHWAWEVYDPARPAGNQILISGGWYPTWDAARRRGLTALRDLPKETHG